MNLFMVLGRNTGVTMMVIGILVMTACSKPAQQPVVPLDTSAVGAGQGDAPDAMAAPQGKSPATNLHPAATEWDYPLKNIVDITTDPLERQELNLLKEPKNGATVLARVQKTGPAGLTLMANALTANNREVRMQAALILANLKKSDKAIVRALCNTVLFDPDPDVRATAAKAFVNINAPLASLTLVRSLTEDPFETARANAAWALGNVGGGDVAINALRKGLKDPDTWVRLRSATALKKLRAKKAIPDLIEALGDQNPMVRERALESLKGLTGKNLGSSQSDWQKAYQ